MRPGEIRLILEAVRRLLRRAQARLGEIGENGDHEITSLADQIGKIEKGLAAEMQRAQETL